MGYEKVQKALLAVLLDRGVDIFSAVRAVEKASYRYDIQRDIYIAHTAENEIVHVGVAA